MTTRALRADRPLTAAQTRIRDAVHRFYAEHHVAPSRRQIGLITGLTSHSYIARVVDKLEARGQMPRRRSRATCPHCHGTGYEGEA